MNQFEKRTTGIVLSLSILMLASCSGGGTALSGDTADGNVIISGTLSDTASSKPGEGSAARRAVNNWNGAEIKVLNSSGEVIGTSTADGGGGYTVSVPAGLNYVIRASKGNLVLKAFLDSAESDTTQNVNPTTMAETVLMGRLMLVVYIGEEGVAFGSALEQSQAYVAAARTSVYVSQVAALIAEQINSDYSDTDTGETIGRGGSEAEVLGENAFTEIARDNIVSICAGCFVATGPPDTINMEEASAGDGEVTLTWLAVMGANDYYIYWSTDPGVTKETGTRLQYVRPVIEPLPFQISGAKTMLGTKPADADLASYTTYVLTNVHHVQTGLANGTKYYFVVTGENDFGEGEISSEVSVTPGAGYVAVSSLDIPDPYFKRCLQMSYGSYDSSWFYIYEFESVSCSVYDRLADLTGIENFIYATSVSFNRTSITDLQPLASLPNLTSLELENNNISDISVLSSLTNITFLALDDNSISDISVLSSLTKMTNLYLANNSITMGVADLVALTKTIIIDLTGNDNIPCADLKTLVNAHGSSVVWQPDSCI